MAAPADYDTGRGAEDKAPWTSTHSVSCKTCSGKSVKSETVCKTLSLCMVLRSYPPMMHLSPRVCIWGTNIHLEKSITFLRMKSLVWKVALWKQRVNKNERRKQRMRGKTGLYWPIQNRTLRPTVVLNVSFKKKKKSKTNSKWSHINPNTRIRGIFQWGRTFWYISSLVFL